MIRYKIIRRGAMLYSKHRGDEHLLNGTEAYTACAKKYMQVHMQVHMQVY